MAVKYNKLHELLSRKGYSIGYLIKHDIIKDFSGRKIRQEEPVDLKYIDAICQFLQVPIEQVVEIIPDDPDEKD